MSGVRDLGPKRLMAKQSPQARAIQRLKADGWMVATVEHWNPFARIRQDLFGIGDLLAVRGSETALVQVTSRSNVHARAAKIAASEAAPRLRDAGWLIWIWGYGKTKTLGDWREVDVS